MKIVLYIMGSIGVFIEVALALQYSLEELGYNVIGIQVYPEELIMCDYTIVIMGKDLLPLLSNGSHGLYPQSFNICFFMEQWRNRVRQKPSINRYKYNIRQYFCRVLDIFGENTLHDPEKSFYCPLGYSPVFEDQIDGKCSVKNIPDEIDFLFFGSPTERRLEIVKNWQGMFFPNYCTGRMRDSMIKRAKINIMLRAYDEWYFPPLHYLLIASKKKIVMVDGYDNRPYFKEGKHFLTFKNRDECLYWLEDEAACRQFAEEAYNDLKKNCNFTDYLGEAIGDLL